MRGVLVVVVPAAVVALVAPLKSPRRMGVLRSAKPLVEVVDELGGRVTSGDVAAVVGDVNAAERELLALAAKLSDGEVRIEAREDGGLVFDFGRRAARRLAKVDRRERWARRWRKAKPGLATAGRLAFGSGLFVSMAVWSALLLAISSSGDNTPAGDDQGDRRGYVSFGVVDRVMLDMWWYSAMSAPDPTPRTNLNFLEAVYSYVFGDGDPNRDQSERELAAAARVIWDNRGVVCADQLAPVVGPDLPADDDTIIVDESWVLPIVAALGGRPTVVEDQVAYVFDDLLRVADATTVGAEEREVAFSRATAGQLAAAGVLGAVNLAGATLLATQLATPAVSAAIGQKTVASLRVVCVPILAYALTYNVLPIVRARRIRTANAKIKRRNRNRRAWNKRLSAAPTSLKTKLAAVKKFATNRRRLPRDDTIAFATDDAFQQAYKDRRLADDLADFDARVNNSRLQNKDPPPLYLPSPPPDNLDVPGMIEITPNATLPLATSTKKMTTTTTTTKFSPSRGDPRPEKNTQSDLAA